VLKQTMDAGVGVDAHQVKRSAGFLRGLDGACDRFVRVQA